MHSVVQDKRREIASLCRRWRVRRLWVFGSVTGERFEPGRSDIDFLVEFEPMPPKEYADSYFGLLFALEGLFSTPVDLVESVPMGNPYFRESVERTRQPIYEAT